MTAHLAECGLAEARGQLVLEVIGGVDGPQQRFYLAGQLRSLHEREASTSILGVQYFGHM